MNQFEDRIRSAHGHLAGAAVIVDEVEHALAKAHTAEVKAEREIAFTAKVGVVVVGAAVAVVVVTLVLRWLFEKPDTEQDGLVRPDGSSIQAAETE